MQGTTAGSTSIGTFGYMPIEQLAGVVDATTDPFALGASLLHLLTRQEPWRVVQGRRLDGINVSPAVAVAAAPVVVAAKEPRWRWTAPLRYAAVAAAFLAVGAGGFSIARHQLRSRAEPGEPSLELVMRRAGEPAPRADVVLRAGEPAMAPRARASLPAGKPVDLDFKGVPLHDILRLLADECRLNIVIPDNLHGAVTINLKQVRCDQAFEVVLESTGLWYEYRPEANVVRIAPRVVLDDEARAARDRALEELDRTARKRELAEDMERAMREQARAAREQERARVDEARAARERGER